MSIRKCLVGLVGLVLAFSNAPCARAAVVTYASRTSWGTAVGPGNYWTEDFSGFTTDTQFRTQEIDLSHFSLN